MIAASLDRELPVGEEVDRALGLLVAAEGAIARRGRELS